MKLSNEWIAGFSDGEGCFNIQKIKRKTTNKTLQVVSNESTLLRHRFIISQDKKSVNVLYGIKEKLKCGTVHKAGDSMMAYQVSKKNHLENIIIPFFQKHTLKTAKREHFSAFVESFSRDYRFLLRNQTTNNSAYNFSDNWFRGFVDASGCFSVSLVKDYPRPQLVIGLQSKEKQVLVELQKFLKCVTLRTRKDGAIILQIVSSKDLERYIFPKLQTRGGAVMLQTRKRISYQIFRKIVDIIRDKNHHTVEGLKKIKHLKNRLSKESRVETECTTNITK